MRIVGGRHRGRRLTAPPGRLVRPTSDRTREALFNILAHRLDLEGADVLDAFAGSGAVGLEALSRGAARAFLLERHPAALDVIRRNIAELGEGGHAVVLRADATRPPPARAACRFVFLDPPYDQGLAAPALAALAARGWLAPEALAVVEVRAREAFEPPDGFVIEDERVYGEARLVLLSPSASSSARNARI